MSESKSASGVQTAAEALASCQALKPYLSGTGQTLFVYSVGETGSVAIDFGNRNENALTSTTIMASVIRAFCSKYTQTLGLRMLKAAQKGKGISGLQKFSADYSADVGSVLAELDGCGINARIAEKADQCTVQWFNSDLTTQSSKEMFDAVYLYVSLFDGTRFLYKIQQLA